jgi:transposase
MKHSNQYKLKMAMLQHNLSVEKVAEDTEVKIQTVRTWLYAVNKVGYRAMPDMAIKLLELQIKQQKRV